MVKKINQSKQSRPVCTPRIFWLLGEALGAPLANSRPLLKTLKQLLCQSSWRNVVSLGGGSCKDGESQKRQENFHSLSGPLSFQEISKTPSNLSGKLLWKEAVTTHPSLSALRTCGITHTSLHQLYCAWTKEFAFGKKLLPIKPLCCLILPSLLQCLQLFNELGCSVSLMNCVNSHAPGDFQE